MREACNTGCKGAAYIGINQSHLSSFIVVLVMHVLNQVQDVDIKSCQPVQHKVILLHDLIVVKILGSNRCISRSDLSAVLLVHTAVDGVQQALCKVCSCTEELHLLTGLCCGYAAADGIVIAPYRLHDIIVLVLDGGGGDGNLSRILLEVLRKLAAVENRQVRLRGRSHVLKRMKETIIVLRYHGTAVHSNAGNLQCCPYRISGKQLIVGLDSCKLHHTELHGDMVDQLLCLGLCKRSFLQITIDVNIKEGGNSAHAHCSAVLSLDCCKIAEVQPLNRFLRIACRCGNVIAVSLCHLLHSLQSTDLLGDFLALTDDVVGHCAIAAVLLILLLPRDQLINTVQSNSAVIADDSSSSVGIRKSGYDMAVACSTHLRCICIKYCLVMRLVVLGKNLVQLRIRMVSVHLARFLCHLDSAEGHERTLQRLVGLKSDHLLQILHGLVDISGAICGQRGNHLRLLIQDAALLTLFLLQLLQSSPKLVSCFGRICQEALISLIRCVVLLDKVAHIALASPDVALKPVPGFIL